MGWICHFFVLGGEGHTLKTSRLALPEVWVARVGGSLHLEALVACRHRCRYLIAIVLGDPEGCSSSKCLPEARLWLDLGKNSFYRFIIPRPSSCPAWSTAQLHCGHSDMLECLSIHAWISTTSSLIRIPISVPQSLKSSKTFPLPPSLL